MCQVHFALQKKDSNKDVTRPLWLRMPLLCILIGSDSLLASVLKLSPSQVKTEVAHFRTEWHLGKGHLSGFSSHCLNLHYFLGWGVTSLISDGLILGST